MAKGSHSQPVERPATRSKNVNQHPGSIVAPRKRRTNTEKKRDDEIASLVKKKVDEQKQEAIMRVARLEDAMAVDDGNTYGAHPRHYTSKSEPTEDPEECANDVEEPPKKKCAPAKDGKRGPHGSQEKYGNERQKGLLRKAQGTKATKKKSKAPIGRQTPIQAVSDGSDEEEENRQVGTISHKPVQNVSRTTKAAQKSIAMIVSSEEEEAIGEEAGDITDNEEAVEPTPIRKGLKRSYAMLDILDVSGNDPADPDFEAPSEREESASAVELYDDNKTPKKKKKAVIPPVKETTSAGIVELDDDEDETPKKKKKVPSVSVREVIKAKWGQTVMKDTSSFTQTSKQSGAVKNWRSLVANQASKSKHEGPGSLAESARTAMSTTLQSKGRTTASSSATWIKSGKSTQKPGKLNDSTTVSCGATPELKGFNDEDETEECEHAVSSPIKGNKQLNSAGIIKVEHTPPPPSKRNGGRKEKYSNVDLPAGCQERNVWRGKLIPTYIQYMSCTDTVWGSKDSDATAILQAIWDYLYGARIPRQIVSTGPVFVIADQRLCEWRCGFGSAALMIINTFLLASEFNTNEERQAVSAEQLEGYTFLYRDVGVAKNGEPKRKGIFGGPLVLQTFAVHLTAIGGAVTVPSIGDPDMAKGALALSAAAVERGFTLWRDGCISMNSLQSASKTGTGIIKVVNDSTGKTSGKATDFNQANWSSITSDYLASITANFRGKTDKFESLMKEAATYVQGKNSRRGNSSSTPSNLDDGIPLGERALLIEESGDEDEENKESGNEDEENDE